MARSAGKFKNAEITVAFLKGLPGRAKLALTFAAGAMAAKAKGYCEDMISARDHSLADLASMGHPYSKRKPNNPHDPPEVVHVQEGNLIAGLQNTAPVANARGASAKVINTSEEDVWVQGGTETMIARPYMERVRKDHAEEIVIAGRVELEARMAAEVKRSA